MNNHAGCAAFGGFLKPSSVVHHSYAGNVECAAFGASHVVASVLASLRRRYIYLLTLAGFRDLGASSRFAAS